MRGNRELVRFGRFTLDRAQRLLTRGGVPVHLTPKAFELLSVLIAAAPRVTYLDNSRIAAPSRDGARRASTARVRESGGTARKPGVSLEGV